MREETPHCSCTRSDNTQRVREKTSHCGFWLAKGIRDATTPTRSFPCQVQKLGWKTFGPKFRPPRGGEEEEKEKEKKKWPKATFFFLFLFLLLPPCGYLNKKNFRTACSCPWSYHPPLQRRGLQRPKSAIRTLRIPLRGGRSTRWTRLLEAYRLITFLPLLGWTGSCHVFFALKIQNQSWKPNLKART